MFSIMIRSTSIKAVKLIYGRISTFFLFSVWHILPSYCKGWFNGVVAITSASHAEGREFEPCSEIFLHLNGCVSMFPILYVSRTLCFPDLCSPVPMFPSTYVPRSYVIRHLCSPAPMFSVLYVPPSYVPQCLCPPVGLSMFSSRNIFVPLYLCSQVGIPMLPGAYIS